jgi:hypothetical protein
LVFNNFAPVQPNNLQFAFRITVIAGAILSLTGMLIFILHLNAQVAFWVLLIALIVLITGMAGLMWINLTQKKPEKEE